MIIGLIGDYNEHVVAHKAIPLALDLASRALSLDVHYHWMDTEQVSLCRLKELDGIWCVPASPYKNTENALLAINFARTNHVPFLGTCGGYQHAALEFAKNALGFAEADNSEVNPEAAMPLIAGLVCKLVEVRDQISLVPGSEIAGIYGEKTINEEYHCSYGVNQRYLPIFDASDMQFTGFDSQGDPRALEIPSHPFFIGTAFQPERSGLSGLLHPLVKAFLLAASNTDSTPV